MVFIRQKNPTRTCQRPNYYNWNGLIELLNFYSEYGSEMRQNVAATVRDILVDLDVEYISHSPEIFLEALDFYEKRLDKGYSLTGCVSMLMMKTLNIREILTHDNHFEQEGFTVLLNS